MRRISVLSALLAAAILSGCSKTAGTFENEVRIIVSGFDNVCNNGELYTDNKGRLNFTDFETMQSVIVCSKPNCTHSDEGECSAFGMDNFTIMYEDKLYFFDTEVIYENDDVREDTTIYKADLDGTNRTALYTIKGYNVETARILVAEDTAYFTVRNVKWSEDKTTKSGREILWLASYKISENKFLMLEKLCEGYSTGIYMYGLWKGGVYFAQTSSEEQWDWDPEDPSGLNREWDERECVYNIAEKTVSEYELPEPFCVECGYYIHQKDGGLAVLTEDGNEKFIANFSAHPYNKIVNGKIFDVPNGLCVDLETGSVITLKSVDGLTQEFIPAAFFDGNYIFKNYTNDGRGYIKIPENELF